MLSLKIGDLNIRLLPLGTIHTDARAPASLHDGKNSQMSCKGPAFVWLKDVCPAEISMSNAA